MNGHFIILSKDPATNFTHTWGQLCGQVWVVVNSREPARNHPPLARAVHDRRPVLSTPHRTARTVPMPPVHTTHSTYYCY
jgi:hypothetical protein